MLDRSTYGTGGTFNPSSKKRMTYSRVMGEDIELETASERHTFSLMPIGIAVSFTAVLIYAILVIQHYRTASGIDAHPVAKT
jgi:hypothetical protein